jgi:hypothetical protein
MRVIKLTVNCLLDRLTRKKMSHELPNELEKSSQV